MDQPKRRRLGGSLAEFVGGKGARPEEVVTPAQEVEAPAQEVAAIAVGHIEPQPQPQPQPPRKSLNDDLDPSGKPYRPASAERQADPRMDGGWGRIVRTVFRLDEEDAFRRVSAVTFEKKPSRMEYGELVDALDECSGLVVLAGQLYENAKVVFKMYETDVETLRAPMRREAKALLAAEKAAGGGKMITNADVDGKIAETWPDEWRRQEENLAKAKGMASQCSNLHDRWVARARELDGFVRTVRKS